MQTVLAIATGGAIGAVLRHFMNAGITHTAGGDFPWGIMAVNILGGLVMGVLAALFAHTGEPPQAWKAFLTVGILGGFTTFSTFSMDAVLLLQRGAWAEAAFYMAGSVLLSIGALCAGMMVVRIFVI